jgi:hypothetical protein
VCEGAITDSTSPTRTIRRCESISAGQVRILFALNASTVDRRTTLLVIPLLPLAFVCALILRPSPPLPPLPFAVVAATSRAIPSCPCRAVRSRSDCIKLRYQHYLREHHSMSAAHAKATTSAHCQHHVSTSTGNERHQSIARVPSEPPPSEQHQSSIRARIIISVLATIVFSLFETVTRDHGGHGESGSPPVADRTMPITGYHSPTKPMSWLNLLQTS